MPTINLHPDYWTHPKTSRLIGRLGKGSEVLPLKLWTHCAIHHAETGRLDGYSAPEIEAVVQWWGKPGEAITSLVAVGFLDRLDSGDYQIHNWELRAGHIVKYQQKARDAALSRWKRPRDAPGIALGNARSNASAMQCRNTEIPQAALDGVPPPVVGAMAMRISLDDGENTPTNRGDPPDIPPQKPAEIPPEPARSARKPRKPPTGAHADLIRFFIKSWEKRYSAKYPFKKMDGIQCAELLQACGGCLEDAQGVITRYLADDGKFFRGHPLGLLTSATQLPRFIAKPGATHANANHAPQRNGQFPEPASRLKIL